MTETPQNGAPKAAETPVNKATEEKTVDDKSKGYNPPLLFLAGLLTFCLGLIVGVFSAIDKTTSAHFPLLGPVLAWTALTAFVATVSVAVLQVARSKGDKNTAPDQGLVVKAVYLPLIPGFFMALACVRLAASMAGGPNFWSGFTKLFG